MDRGISLLVALLSGQVQQAPGSRGATLRALEALRPLPPRPQIVELGCGRGASALILAEATDGEVLAIDLLPEMAAATAARAPAGGGGGGVRAAVGDMADPSVAPGSADLIWSEGAAYSVGFERALAAWRPLLKPGGGVAVSELCWRAEAPSAEAAAYWEAAYPGMRSARGCREVFEAAGYRLVTSFFLPREAWAAYYEPLAGRLEGFLAAHEGDPVAAAVVAEMAAEIDAWRRWGEEYGYLFLVGRAE
jgi:SAM-dependent methyltransferase